MSKTIPIMVVNPGLCITFGVSNMVLLPLRAVGGRHNGALDVAITSIPGLLSSSEGQLGGITNPEPLLRAA